MAQKSEQKAGTSATLAIIAAAGSYLITFTGNPGWGLVAALISIPLGVIGLLMSASPRVGGGLLSVIALIVGLLAIGIAVLGLIGAIVF